MNKISLDDQFLIVKSLWKDPKKYGRKLTVTNHGFSYYSIGFNETSQQLLNRIKQDNQVKKKWWKIW